MTDKTKQKEQTGAYRPTRLDLTHLPRDTTRALGSLRQQLCGSFNYCRAYPAKMDVLDATLTRVLKEVRKFKVEVAEQEKLKAARIAEQTTKQDTKQTTEQSNTQEGNA